MPQCNIDPTFKKTVALHFPGEGDIIVFLAGGFSYNLSAPVSSFIRTSMASMTVNRALRLPVLSSFGQFLIIVAPSKVRHPSPDTYPLLKLPLYSIPIVVDANVPCPCIWPLRKPPTYVDLLGYVIVPKPFLRPAFQSPSYVTPPR